MRNSSLRVGMALAALAAATPSPGLAQTGPAPSEPAEIATSLTLMSAVAPCTDLDRSVAFYTRGLGLKAAKGANPREVVLEFPGGGARLMLYKMEPAGGAHPIGVSRFIFTVPDMKAVAAQLQSAGYKLSKPIIQNAQYRISIAEVEDPDGNSIEMIQRGG